MEKQARIREVKLNIESEFVLNLVTYLIREENYVFVGNQHEIWLENLSHPKVQLIYINDQKKMTVGHATYISKKSQIISRAFKRKFLMSRVHTIILNTCDFDAMIENDENHYALIVNVENAEAVNQNETLNHLFPEIVNTNLNASLDEIAAKLQIDSKSRATSEADMSQHKMKPAVINNIYIVLVILYFAYLWFRNRELPTAFVAIHYGATYNPLIAAGEYWRLIASAFMHLEPMHLVFNAVFIYRFGSMIEDVFGKWRMVVIILISAITASLFGFALSTSFSIGASGVAYGFIGALVFLGFEMRRTFMPLLRQIVIPVLVISVVFSLFMPNIDHFGHLGGFVGGFFAAAIVGVPKIKLFIARAFLSLATLVILISGLWVSGTRLTESYDFDSFNRALIFEYIELGNIERASQLVEIFFGEVE